MNDTVQPLSPVLASVLASGRKHFNLRVIEAQQRYPKLDTTAFATFIRTGLDSVARSVDAVAPEHASSVVVAGYDIALELVGQGLVGAGARSGLVDRVWISLAPLCARLVATDPAEVLGLLSNAVIHLAGVPTARADDWMTGMAKVVGQATSVAQLRALGQVMAWRSGLAHFRDGALRGADTLPEPLALLATAADPSSEWSAVRDAYRADPWWSPNAGQRELIAGGISVGRFTGFGGTFPQPPEARATGQGFIVRSANRFSLLIADAYGAMLLPASAEEFAQAGSGATPSVSLTGANLAIGNRRMALDLPAEGLAIAANTHTVAVTSPWSHAIRLLPRS